MEKDSPLCKILHEHLAHCGKTGKLYNYSICCPQLPKEVNMEVNLHLS